MRLQTKLLVLLVALLLGLGVREVVVWAEDANGNIVIAAGETWGTYAPANYFPGVWPRLSYKDDLAARAKLWQGAESALFYTTRLVTSGLFGNPGWSWPFGTYVVDFANAMFAIEYNPNEQFAALNEKVSGKDNRNYALLMYNTRIPGANDPTRNYRIPSTGGAVLSADRNYAYGVSAWPTQLGVDVKMTVHSWTQPYGRLDNFHLVEFEFYNTGKADINGDGTVDIENNRINGLVLVYTGDSFGFGMGLDGGRYYWQPNSRFRGEGVDLTPDENGSPWDISFQGYGSDAGEEDFPGLGDNGFYYDQYNGYTYLGAKKLDPTTNTWVEKKLAFKDASGNEVVPAVGEGAQRGWFRVHQPGYNAVNDGTPRNVHTAAMGCFYLDGGKSNDRSKFNLKPNPAIFASGDSANLTTFVVKDPSQWTYPDGAYEKATPKMWTDPQSGRQLGLSPTDPARGRPLEPGIITEGLITEYRFDGDKVVGCGPFAMEVGEKIRVYFVRGSGFRIKGLRAAIKAARTVFASIKPDGSYEVPQAPPVPDIKIGASANVRPLIKWKDPGAAADGIKIYKSKAWPRFNPMEKGWPTMDTYWKTMDPATQPAKEEVNPVFTDFARVREQQGGHWGPYELVKVIPKAEFANNANPDASDKATYPYAWEDNSPGTLPGFTFYYYVASYKTGAPVPTNYVGLEPANINWLESGKVNVDGRSGKWESTWPWTENHAYFPRPEDTAKRKDVGVRFVLVPTPKDVVELQRGRAKITVRPNPYKRAAFHDALGQHQVMFFNLPKKCTISIFDVAGQLVDRIYFEAVDPNNGSTFWDMYSKDGNEVASGLYIWVAEFEGGRQTGYFSILR